VPKCGMKVPHLRCDSHTSFKVKRLKVRVTDGWGHTLSAEPGGQTACSECFESDKRRGLALNLQCVCIVLCCVFVIPGAVCVDALCCCDVRGVDCAPDDCAKV